MSTKTCLSLLALVAVAQWFVPLRMIFDQEEVLANGQIYQFKVAPIDPNDPFRGKYIVLNIEQDMVAIDNPEDWESGETIYVLLTKDDEGLAYPVGIAKERPADNDYIQAKINYVIHGYSSQAFIEYPFERYYMEESKAPRAERLLNADSLTAYLHVRVMNGESATEALMINEVTIEEWLDATDSKEAMQ